MTGTTRMIERACNGDARDFVQKTIGRIYHDYTIADAIRDYEYMLTMERAGA